jgi:superfamily II DNA or RNA helicase
MPERPYQEICNTNVIAAYDQNWHQQIVSMATGTGKTWVFSALYERIKSRLPGQMLVLAHTEELVDQNIDAMREVNPSLRVDKEMAEHKADPSQADIICASVKTLGRLGTSRLAKYDMAKWDKVIVDEAHHTPANSYMNILNAFGVLQDGTKKLLLGVTATPERMDGKALGAIYKKLTYVYSLRQAIDDGYLVKVRGYKVTTGTNLSNVSIEDGDFNKIELEKAIDSPERNEQVVDAWVERCEGRKTVVYAAGIEHAKHLAAQFMAHGIPSAAVWGGDPDRKAKLEWHRNTAGGVLVNAALLVEGYNDPSISCIVIAAPTASSVKFTQMCGRATRLFPGKIDCIILDMVDSSGGHSLCTLPTLMGLPSNLDMCGQSLSDTCKLIEDMQVENPSIDFTKLKSADGLQQFITEVNLFEIRFAPEVEGASDFKWSKAIDGGYVMNIPRPTKDSTGTPPGRVKIYKDMLDKWHVSGIIKSREFHGLRDSMEEAFAGADQQIRERSPESVCMVNRKASWNNDPASSAQIKILARLYKGQKFPDDFTKGQASLWIDKKLNRFKN